MSDKGTRQNGEDSQKSEKPPKYYIDEGWFERRGRSFQYMIESRLSGMELPVGKPTRKRGKTAPKAPSMEELSQIEGFVNPELPVLEAVFRLLLIHQNKPLDVEQIGQELAERGLGVLDARVVTPETLTRVLDHDFHYGIKRYQGR